MATFVYTPRSGSRILASHGLTVVTLANGSHLIPQDCAVLRCGDGGRAQRAAFRRVAAAICRLVGGIAVDDRGDCAIYTRDPGAAACLLDQAGIECATTSIRLLAQGWAELAEHGQCIGYEAAPSGVEPAAVCAALRAESPYELFDLRVQWAPRDDRPGRPWLWALGQAAWRSGRDVDFEISPAPASVMGVPTGTREWKLMARIAMCEPLQPYGDEPGSVHHVATEIARALRHGTSENPVCSSPRGWRARWGRELEVADLSRCEVVLVMPTPSERSAQDAIEAGDLTEIEVDALTGGVGAGLASDPEDVRHYYCPPGGDRWHSVGSPFDE